MTRKIPSTMATQHPDNVCPPFWSKYGEAFISVFQESDEALINFIDLKAEEYMWDWEGKHADTMVVDRWLNNNLEYFSKFQLGRDKFLTFRIPNIKIEKGYNLLQALTVILTSEDLKNLLNLESRPLFEVILPMTNSAKELIHIQKLFKRLANFKNISFTPNETDNLEYVEIIPLLESFDRQLQVDSLLGEYLNLHKKNFGFLPTYIRCFLAGSDISLETGFLAAIIVNKVSISKMYSFARDKNIKIHPIIGFGSTLFRGGLKPTKYSINRFKSEFSGVKTVTIQSSFRYDWPKKLVNDSIEDLNFTLPKLKPLNIPVEDQEILIGIAKRAARFYKKTLSAILKDVSFIFNYIPKRRERRQHVGLLSYGRMLGEKSLPRAITFVSGFYSLGIPPELIGLGRSLSLLESHELITLKKYYRHIYQDLTELIQFYFNEDNLVTLSKKNPSWNDLWEDIEGIREFLNQCQVKNRKRIEQVFDKQKYKELTTKILQFSETNQDELPKLILEAAFIRKNIG